MTNSSAGSTVFFSFALLAIALLVLLLLRHYLPLRTTPGYLLLPVFLSLALPASIVLLVPIDLASSAVDEDGSAKGIWLPERALLVLWRMMYWLTFVLTWVVLPLLADYVDSGYREPKARILYSLRCNARYQLTVLACAIVGLIYVFIQIGIRDFNIKALVMALAYSWGLILAIFLMGNGLVALPRRLYRSADISGRLRQLQTQAPGVHERMTNAIEELDTLEHQILQLQKRKTGTARNFQDWIEELSDPSDLPTTRANLAPAAPVEQVAIPSVITERYLADVTRKLKRARHKRIRFIEEWDRLVCEAKGNKAILDAAPSQRLDSGILAGSAAWSDQLSFITPYMRYHLHANILPKTRLLASAVFGIASFCIIWSEIFKSAVPKISIVGLSIVHHPKSDNGKIGFAGQVMASFWLLYMCTAALASITEVKIWGNRALVQRNTYGESACWYACQVAKLTVPLSYNFITFVPRKIFENTAFYHFLGRLIDLTPLGTGFSAFFPIFILVSALATAFNLYGKAQKLIGYGVLEDDSQDDSSAFGWHEGRSLIENDLNSADALVLASRGHSPLPGDRRTDTFSSLNSTTTTTQAPSGRQDRQRVISRPAPVDEEDEGGFFQDFAHRVKNTLDATERPEWVANFPRPKWMGGVDGNTESSGRADAGRGLGRWFGGRPDDGRVRL